MEDYREIIVEDIPSEGLEIRADGGVGWFRTLLKDVFKESFEDDDKAKIDLDVVRIDQNIDIDGEIECSVHHDCDRCAERYQEVLSIPISRKLAPLYENERQRRLEERLEAELVKEDFEFDFYEGDRFDLIDIIREQLILAQPMKHLCSLTCAGICQKCGKNLNDGPCDCKSDHVDPRWDVLKELKIEKN